MRSPVTGVKTKANIRNRSSFLLTVNTNVVDDSIIGKLRAAFNVYYDNLEGFLTYKDGKGSIDLIDSSDCEVAIERGPKYKRIHLHAIIQIGHRPRFILIRIKCASSLDSSWALTAFI